MIRDSESMIAGKTYSEILSMPRSTRSDWYKKISKEEREEIMRSIEFGRRAKISAAYTSERRVEDSARMTGNVLFEETKVRISTSLMGHSVSEETRTKISASSIGKIISEESRIKQSTSRIGKYIGENHWNWQGGLSSEPYCSAFNFRLKEHIRNLYGRVCTICGRTTLQNVNKNGKWTGRLAVDHLDENKMQGCDDWEWRLTALCTSCHGKMMKREIPYHLLLHLLLLNNKGHQTNFLFENMEVEK